MDDGHFDGFLIVGKRAGLCERVVSSDHSRHEAGDSVTIFLTKPQPCSMTITNPMLKTIHFL